MALAGGPLVILVHAGFGLVEGVKDMVADPARTAHRGVPAVPWTPVFAAAASHLAFGAVTAVVASLVAVGTGAGAKAGSWWPWAAGALGAFALHAAWNYSLLRAMVRAKTPRKGGR